MLISYNWLKEFLPDLTQDPAEVAEVLTMGLFESEISTTIAIDPLTVAVKILSIAPHPNADRLQLATIDTGKATEVIVCGAPNIEEGQMVPFSPSGATVRDEDGSNFTLKTVSIRGVESPGMLNSPRELGLGEWHGGIYVLPPDVEIGTPLKALIPDDVVLEVELTPNRAHDCYSHRGLAREIASLLSIAIVEPKTVAPEYAELKDWQLEVSPDDHDVRAYFGTLLDGLVVQPSPMWIQTRLWAVGARPINNVVDITNLVMFEMGGPSHAFDADKLPGQTISVRRARKEETVATLDGQTHSLTQESLVVTSDDEPVALAGVMGGKSSEVDHSSTRAWLEIANFYPYTIYRTSRVHALLTEGSKRWVKDVPTSLAKEVSDRTIELLVELAQARVVGQKNQPPAVSAPVVIEFDPQRPEQVAGVPITLEQVQRALVRQRCLADTSVVPWRVEVPDDRIDLREQHDLVEDVLRIVGYNTIASNIPASDHEGTIPDLVQWREIIRDLLRDDGFTEVQNISFADDRIPESGATDVIGSPLVVENPSAPELAQLRIAIEPALLNTVLENRAELTKKGRVEHALFEFGKVFMEGNGLIAGVEEREQLVGVLLGARATLDQGQAVLNRITSALGVAGDNLGTVREVPTQSALGAKARLPMVTIVMDFNDLVTAATVEPIYTPSYPRRDVKYEPFSKYPTVYRDISIVVPDGVTIEQLQGRIAREGGELVSDVDLFDEYSGPDNQQSYGFRIAYQSAERTLTGDEVAQIHNKIVQTLKDELGVAERE